MLNVLIAERIVLVHSPSGAGKTSLIHAGLIPKLREQRFFIFPTIRLGTPVEEQDPLRGSNRYLASVQSSFEKDRGKDATIQPESLADVSLERYLRSHAKASGDSQFQVLIFDQFEEILTVDPLDRKLKVEFFQQLGEALEDGHRWAIFAMREEYVAALDPFLIDVPTRLETRFRLDLLHTDQALEAIQSPAARSGVNFTDPAARKLVDDLRVTRVKEPGEEARDEKGEYIEPLHLQLACQRIWEQLGSEQNIILENDIEAVGDIDEALADYYAAKVGEIASDPEIGVDERAIRDWFDQQLITPHGIRGQSLYLPGELATPRSERPSTRDASKSRKLRELLVDSYLVRAENRRGATWFELSHDRLVEPVRENNETWRRAKLSLLQREAASWVGLGKPDGTVLIGSALAEAKHWAHRHEDRLLPSEREFLSLSERTRKAGARKLYLNLGGISLIVVMSVLSYSYAVWLDTRPWGKLVTLATGQAHELKGRILAVGRSTDEIKTDISFVPGSVSRFHLLLTRTLTVMDLRSMNGTSVNGEFLYYGKERKIAEGDILVFADLAATRIGTVTYGRFQLWPARIDNEEVPDGSWAILIDGKNRKVSYLQGPMYFLSTNASGEIRASENASGAQFLQVHRGQTVRTKDDLTLTLFSLTNLADSQPLLAEMKLGDYTYGRCVMDREISSISYDWKSDRCTLTERREYVEKGREEHLPFQVIYQYANARFRIIPVVHGLEEAPASRKGKPS